MSAWCLPYVAGRLVRRLMPEALARARFSNDKGSMDDLVAKHRRQLEGVLRAGVDLRGATILEIGPGRYNPAAVAFLGCGARRVVFAEHVRGDLDPAHLGRRIEELLGACGNGVVDIQRLAAVDPEESPQRTSYGHGSIEFLWRSAADTALPDQSVDAVFSHSVLQCLAEPEAVIAEIARVLRPGGFTSHLVDLRDHFFRYPLQFLCYSDYVWSHVLTSRRPHKAYLNRLRLPELHSLFASHGIHTEALALTEDRELSRRMRPYLHRRFREFSDEELAPQLVEMWGWKTPTVAEP